MIALLLAVSWADSGRPAPPFAPGEWDIQGVEVSVDEAEARFVPLRAEMRALRAREDTWWKPAGTATQPLPPAYPDDLDRLAHLLRGPLGVYPTDEAVWGHESHDRRMDGSWRFERWTSAFRTELSLEDWSGNKGGDPVERALFWEKTVSQSRGTWTVETDTLLVWADERLATVFQSARTDDGPVETLTRLSWDGRHTLVGIEVLELRGPHEEGGEARIAGWRYGPVESAR